MSSFKWRSSGALTTDTPSLWAALFSLFTEAMSGFVVGPLSLWGVGGSSDGLSLLQLCCAAVSKIDVIWGWRGGFGFLYTLDGCGWGVFCLSGGGDGVFCTGYVGVHWAFGWVFIGFLAFFYTLYVVIYGVGDALHPEKDLFGLGIGGKGLQCCPCAAGRPTAKTKYFVVVRCRVSWAISLLLP